MTRRPCYSLAHEFVVPLESTEGESPHRSSAPCFNGEILLEGSPFIDANGGTMISVGYHVLVCVCVYIYKARHLTTHLLLLCLLPKARTLRKPCEPFIAILSLRTHDFFYMNHPTDFLFFIFFSFKCEPES